MAEVEERIDRLEEMIYKTQWQLQSLSFEVSRTQINIEQLSKEMKDFKNEIREDTRQLKVDLKQETKKLNENLQGLSKKLGTIVEDIVIPNIEHIAEKYFNCVDLLRFLPRVKASHISEKGENREYDFVAIYRDKVIVCEAKATPRTEDIESFTTALNEFYSYFPECNGKEIIPIFASFYIPEHILKNLSRSNIYGMGMKEDTMDILNFDNIK